MGLRTLVAAAVVASAVPALAVVEPSGAADGPTVTAGNDIYTVVASNVGAPAAGTVTLATGARNPFGGGRSLLWAGADGLPRSSYVSVRLYGGDPTDFTQGDRGGGSVNLDGEDPVVEPIGTTGVRTTYELGGFELEEAAEVGGTVFEDSFVNIDLTLRNTTSVDQQLGLRLLLDTAIDHDDGPTFELAGGVEQTTAADFVDPAAGGPVEFRLRDNDTNAGQRPTFALAGRTSGTTTPDLLQYACEPEAATFPFDYEIHAAVEVASPSDDCGPEHGGDSAVLLYWGATEGDAIVLGPGASTTVTVQLNVEPVRPIPTVLSAVPVLLNLNPLRLTDLTVAATLRTAFGVPVTGRQVLFTTPAGSVLCAGTTDGAGTARCRSFMTWLTALLNLSYRASFPGDLTYGPSTATAPLIR